MTFDVIFEEKAISNAAEFLADDRDGVRQLLETIDALVDEPRPSDSFPFGSADVRRLRIGRYRVVYAIQADTIAVVHIGRALP